MNPKVSVIVAIYNAEKTLRRCLDSLSDQTLQDIEVILVDDGSTDGSLNICQEYVQDDSRFRCFHKENEGVSATRQFGLDRATGEYVIHLDADDYVDKRIYQEMYDEAIRKSADIVFVDILRLEGNGNASIMRNNLSSWTHRAVLDAMIYKLFGSLCNRLVRRNLFEKYDVRFPAHMQYLEDKLMLIKVLSRSFNAGEELRFGYVPKAYLYYDTTANDSSLTKVSPRDKFNYRFAYWQKAGKELNLDVFGQTYYDLLVEYAFNVFWNRVLSPEEMKSIFSPYTDKIRKEASCGARKYLVLLAISGKGELAYRRKWVAAPFILKEKIRLYRNLHEARKNMSKANEN